MAIRSQNLGVVRLSWPRRQWLKAVAWIQDHPAITLIILGSLASFTCFYAFRLHGIEHFRESFSRWRLENFGGRIQVDRSIRIPDVVLSFRKREYDHLDIMSPTTVHLGGRAYREELGRIIESEGSMRIMTLDPRLADPAHPHHEAFNKLGEAFGQLPWEFSARCDYSAAVLIHLKDSLGEKCEVGFIAEPDPEAKPPYFTLGRIGQGTVEGSPRDRLDVLVPRPEIPTGTDSMTHPGVVILGRPDDPQVVEATKAFERLWSRASMLTLQLRSELMEKINGQTTAN